MYAAFVRSGISKLENLFRNENIDMQVSIFNETIFLNYAKNQML